MDLKEVGAGLVGRGKRGQAGQGETEEARDTDPVSFLLFQFVLWAQWEMKLAAACQETSLPDSLASKSTFLGVILGDKRLTITPLIPH